MSRLHAFMASAAQIAAAFGARDADQVTVHQEVTEGLPGLVVIERDGVRRLRNMMWGFPRHTRGGDEGAASLIGLVADLTNPMWSDMVVDPRYRCLIPITHFGNPDGVPGGKTRTWFSVECQPVMAWAGFCRNTQEFGPVYAGMTMEANAAIPPTNDRMPVLLDPHQYETWFHGSIRDVIGFQFGAPIAASRMVVERTEDLWRSDGLPTVPDNQLTLL